jgi:hypothetical protein
VIVVFIATAIGGGKKLHQQTITIPSGSVSGAPESAVFAGPIFVPATSNVEVRIEAPVSNSWLYLEGALINEETGSVDEFDAEVAYYSGSDSDGSWTEGGTSATRYIPSVPAGRYTLRLEPQWEAGRQPPSYELGVRSRVPRFFHLLLAGLALLAWPLGLAWSKLRFEARRWSESDHSWTGSD